MVNPPTGRAELHKAFIERFAAVSTASALRKFTSLDLDAIDRHFKIELPEAYRHFATAYGNVWTPNILDMVVDHVSDTPDLSEFVAPDEFISETEGWWTADMPAEMIGFARDCGGNTFCFLRADLADKPDDVPVWLYDHDLGDSSVVAPTFDEWLSLYLKLPGDAGNASGA